MITGARKQDLLTVDDILRFTNQGYDIYRYYLGKVQRLMDRPWPGEKKENKPSWGINYYNGTWVWVDNAREEKGNAITFVQRYFGLDFVDAIARIAWDFGLKGGREVTKSTIVNWTAPTVEEQKEYAHIAFTHKPWSDEHYKFWDNTGVTEDHCLRYECYAVKDAAINRRRVRIRPNEVVWAYYCPEEDAVKLYFPERRGEKDIRFWTNVKGTHLWNFSNIGECNNLIIQKSNKDKLINLLYNPNITCPQNEKTTLFDATRHPEIVQSIESKCIVPTVFYGSDEDGRTKSKKIISLTGWKEKYTPLDLLPKVNDLYGYAKEFGPKETETFLKLNKLI